MPLFTQHLGQLELMEQTGPLLGRKAQRLLQDPDSPIQVGARSQHAPHEIVHIRVGTGPIFDDPSRDGFGFVEPALTQQIERLFQQILGQGLRACS